MDANILDRFHIKGEDATITPFGSGLINCTWLIHYGGKTYILQKINTHIFNRPDIIDSNIRQVADYLLLHYPDYLFPRPIDSINCTGLETTAEGCFRLFPFVEDSHAYTIAEVKELAYEAARQFGKFTSLLAGFNATQLQTTLPDFHNLALRYQQFEQAVQNAAGGRAEKAAQVISALKAYENIVTTYNAILENASFKKRVTHHDTKISNVLFDKNNKGLCVIDLDTIMPGYFISDVGDMMRTYLSPAGEEETDFQKILIREDYFEAIVKGYLSEMKEELTTTEKQYFIYAGKFMIYMQALRFITDYLNNDIYYGARYELHNYNRAMNQLILLNKLQEKEKLFNDIVDRLLL